MRRITTPSLIGLTLALSLMGVGGAGAQAPEQAPEANPARLTAPDGTPILVLHQAPCLIKEAEADASAFESKSRADCARINRATASLREDSTRLLRLPAGKYVFRIYNDTVPYEVGFEIKGAQDPGLPTTRGGGVKAGGSRDFPITLVPGRYVYRCPLNETPAYPLIVEASGVYRGKRITPSTR